ncbi:FAS1-like dehydratase domain-containing protein [Paracoccus marinus]|uniref:FAS1-like dehydratase domain-containing protein n=1 Tax=Paracoccus marinus TaxID=288426 RepID=UPI00163D53E4|nr:MaoC family dehydratase N-terminal domain-containing protein [Paracoccus marinus]GLS79605.1 dehydratase [Paracoccus marinus]
MSDTIFPPRGLFNRATTGLKTDPIFFDVEAGRISFFAETLGEDDPVYHDRDDARAAGHPDVPAPPTFPCVVDLETSRIAKRMGRTPIYDLIGCDYTRLLHGEETYEYFGPIYAGDRVSFTTEVVGFEDKKGGALETARLRAEIRHARRGLLVAIERVLVHRLN